MKKIIGTLAVVPMLAGLSLSASAKTFNQTEMDQIAAQVRQTQQSTWLINGYQSYQSNLMQELSQLQVKLAEATRIGALQEHYGRGAGGFGRDGRDDRGGRDDGDLGVRDILRQLSEINSQALDEKTQMGKLSLLMDQIAQSQANGPMPGARNPEVVLQDLIVQLSNQSGVPYTFGQILPPPTSQMVETSQQIVFQRLNGLYVGLRDQRAFQEISGLFADMTVDKMVQANKVNNLTRLVDNEIQKERQAIAERERQEREREIERQRQRAEQERQERERAQKENNRIAYQNLVMSFIRFHKDAGFRGDSFNVIRGTAQYVGDQLKFNLSFPFPGQSLYQLDNLGNKRLNNEAGIGYTDTWNDSISSIYIDQNGLRQHLGKQAVVRVCQNAGLGIPATLGRCIENIVSSIDNLANVGFNDQISSIQVFLQDAR